MPMAAQTPGVLAGASRAPELPSRNPGRHTAGEAEENLWFLGRMSPVAASAECFVSGSGLTGNPCSLSALGSAGCGHRAAGDGLGVQQDRIAA